MEEQQAPLSVEVQEQLPPPQGTFLEKHGVSPILFGILVLVFVFFSYQIIGGVIAYMLFGTKPTADNVMGFRIVTGFSQFIFLLIPTLLLTRLATFSPLDYLRIRKPDVRALLLPLVGIFSLQQMLQIYLVFQEKLPVPQELQSIFQEYKQLIEEAYSVLVGSHSIPEFLLVIVVIAIIPAIAEEVLFRGLVQRSFEKGLGSYKGLLLTGFIFGAYHLNPFSLIPLIVLGVYLGFLAMRANSLWVSIAAHFYNNASACIAIFLQQDDDAIITGNPNEMSIGMLLGTFWLFGVIFLLSTYYFVHITKPALEIHNE